MVHYVKCPRCELNYINSELQEYCDVCLKEMKGIRTDSDELEDVEAQEVPTELCPVCGENMMLAGEKMCEECRKKMEDVPEASDEDDDEWREYLDDETDLEEDETLDKTFGEDFGEDFDEEAEEDEEEEEEEEFVDEDDFDYVTGDEIYSLSDDEDDEDDEKEDDDF